MTRRRGSAQMTIGHADPSYEEVRRTAPALLDPYIARAMQYLADTEGATP